MTVTVRDFRPSDADDVAELFRVALPFMVTTPQTVAWEVAHSPAVQRYRVLVAESGGRVVGNARVGVLFESSAPGQVSCEVSVHPAHRGHGAGTALADAGERYAAELGATTVLSWVLDDGRSPGFAERRGYRRGRSSSQQRLDLAAGPLPPVPALPDGMELTTAAAFTDDPRPFFECFAAALLDEPGDVAVDPLGYDDWLAGDWARPDIDRDLTSVVVDGGVVAAFSVAQVDGRSRYRSAMTGSRRAYRGRGLAKLAKTDSLHRARAAGYTEAFTGNDTGNAPMLAINAWLGYRPTATEWHYLRDLPR